jgi:tRNA G10  N-methylase Trm11
VKDIIRIAKVCPGESILEPCVGSGAIAEPIKAVGATVTTNDLVATYGYTPDSTGDFTRKEYRRQFDRVVTNPPFRLASAFIAKSLEVAPEAWMLLRLQFLEGKKREALLRRHLAEIHVYVSRVNFIAGSSSAMCFCWMKFVRDSQGQPPKLFWI